MVKMMNICNKTHKPFENKPQSYKEEPSMSKGRSIIAFMPVLLVYYLGLAQVSADIPGLSFVPIVPMCQADRPLYLTQPNMEGEDVAQLQEQLKAWGYYSGKVDGIFGEKTQAAIIKFQQDNRLTPNGVADDEVWNALYSEDSLMVVKLPPPQGEVHLEIDTKTLRLHVYADGKQYTSFPVAVGRPSAGTLSPVGEWKIIYKGSWGGGFGTRFMGLNVPWGTYGIHGTNKPGSIGTRASHGCIRMYNHDVEQLFEWVKIGTKVIITGDPPKVSLGRALKEGISGKDVVIVQTRLRQMGFDPGGADGRFGANTKKAVLKLQEIFGLPPDGTVYPDVYYVLGLK
jgi:peptidoglycan hydrolase-like protein with peptidoglycan-binding domain